jgi:hypothetical protein
MLGTTRHTLDLAGHPDNRRLMGYGRHIRGGPPDVENQGGVPDQDQALPEETRQRQRQAKAKGLTSPRATAKRAAQRRKAASKGRR